MDSEIRPKMKFNPPLQLGFGKQSKWLPWKGKLSLKEIAFIKRNGFY